MSFGGDIRIHPQRDGSNGVHSSGALSQGPQFRLALHIEEHDFGLQGGGEFFPSLAHTGKYDALRCPFVGSEHALQFSPGDDVKAAPFFGKQPQNAQVRIGFDGVTDDVGDFTERTIKRCVAFVNHCGRIHVKRGAVLFHELCCGQVLAVQNKNTASAQESLFHLTIQESRPASDRQSLTSRSHFFLLDVDELPRTRIATTVWSSKVSTPAACSATALKMDSTTHEADCSVHSAITCSVRRLPKSSPLLLRASRMPSLKNTNMSPGFMRNSNSSYSASSKRPSGKPVASMTSFLPPCTKTGRGRPELDTVKVRCASSQTA